jgi:gliding motility-associated-like protein
MVAPPPIALATGMTVCAGQNAVLTASGGTNYSWSNGATTSSITATATATYSVIVSIGSCSDTASASVVVNPTPTVSVSGNVTITAGNSATLSASGGGNYLWSNGGSSSSITVSAPATTMYCVYVSNSFNCVDTNCIIVTVVVEPLDCSSAITGELFFPNVFSPNGDNENDVIKIYYGNYACIKSFEVFIYNRWGERVFETTDPIAAWDGSFRGKAVGPAVFTYYMKVTLIDGDEIVKRGNISLIK